MIRFGRRGILSPGEMFPAGDAAYRVNFPRLRSGIMVRAVERGNPTSPPVVLVHGWGCSAYVFRRNMPALAEAGFRAIAIDLKGHGLSDKPVARAEYTIDSLVDHLRDILDALELERPALVGHSLGGSLIYHFVCRYPERAQCLGLLAPVGLKGVPLMWLYRLLTPGFLAPMMRRINPRPLVRVALMRVYGKRGHFTDRDIDEYLAPAQFPEFHLAMRELLHSYDWNAAEHRHFSRLELPVAGVWGRLDHMMASDGMSIYESLIPQIALYPVPDAGHVVAEETPREVNEALIALLQSCRPDPRILQIDD
ncbi:MAG TPA: alpha/beta hydrolase [Gemmatimonadaceae bacterium]